MPLDPQDIMNVLAAGSIFVLVMSLWIGGVLVWSAKRSKDNRRLKERMGTVDSPYEKTRELHLWHDDQHVSTTVPDAGRRVSMMHRMDNYLRKAGWEYRAGPMLALVAGAFFMFVVFLTIVTDMMLLGLGAGLGALVVFKLLLDMRIARREKAFEQQLVDSMELAARSLRAGHPLLGAFHLISEEMPDPVSRLFADICQRHELGASLEESLREAARDSTSDDMQLFATSVAIQMKTGGNLADLTERLAQVIRDRMRLGRRVKVLTAQTQMSKRVLVALPFLVFLLFNFLNPDYMSPLYTTSTGHVLLGFCVFGLAAGAWMINKMAVLRY